ncbi:MAG TPA: DUF1573 domain-containing protein [Fulvivirga sp.]|nr:DUF1573 domain-containing protein [Fulvivirga sp.]
MSVKFRIILVFIFLSGQSFAQQVESISFLETTYDFGKVNEADGPIIHEFSFKNNSEEPIQIVGVQASCGCTTPSWTKVPILPGEMGQIQAQYNPANRPGAFNKSLTVTTNLKEPIKLYIRGEVIPKTKSIAEELGTEIGALRLKYATFNMGKVYINKEASQQGFRVYIQSDKPVTFLDKYDAPNYIRLTFEPKILAPKSEGVIKVIYDGSLKNDYGYMNDGITFYTNEAGESAAKQVSVFATILEYFGAMSQEEVLNAPRVSINEDTHDFGRVRQGNVVTKEFIITNTGLSDLVIHKVSPNCTCLKGILDSEKIKSGKSATLKVSFDPEDRRGNQQKSITLYSNDPRSSTLRVTVKAYLEE